MGKKAFFCNRQNNAEIDILYISLRTWDILYLTKNSGTLWFQNLTFFSFLMRRFFIKISMTFIEKTKFQDRNIFCLKFNRIKTLDEY